MPLGLLVGACSHFSDTLLVDFEDDGRLRRSRPEEMDIAEPRCRVFVHDAQLRPDVVEFALRGEQVRDALPPARREKPVVRRQVGRGELELVQRRSRES